MSARYMLDTNICIYLRQNRPPEVTARFRQMQHGDAVLSVITYGELLYGAERSQQRSRALESLVRLVSLLSVVPLPEDAAAAYGETTPRSRPAGRGSVAMISGLLLMPNPRASLSSPTMNGSSSAFPASSSRTGPAAILDVYVFIRTNRQQRGA